MEEAEVGDRYWVRSYGREKIGDSSMREVEDDSGDHYEQFEPGDWADGYYK